MNVQILKDKNGLTWLRLAAQSDDERRSLTDLETQYKRYGAQVRFPQDGRNAQGPEGLKLTAEPTDAIAPINPKVAAQWEVVELTYTCVCGKGTVERCAQNARLDTPVFAGENSCCKGQAMVLTHTRSLKHPSLKQIAEAYQRK